MPSGGRAEIEDVTEWANCMFLISAVPQEGSFQMSTHFSLKFSKWGPKKSEDGANGDRVLFKYCILFHVCHDHKVWS